MNAADPNHVLIATDGHPMMTTNDGALWRQVYVDPAFENPAGAPIPHGKAYRGNGLDIVVNYFTCFPNASKVLIACNDNGVITSGDAGQTWAFRQSRSSLPNGDVYQIVAHPLTGTLYANNPFTQTPYQFKAVGDADIDPAATRISSVRFLATGQTNWSLLKVFPGAPMWLTIDPFDTERMYVSVAYSVNGGIYFTTNLSAGTNAAWTLLTTNKPASMGLHPFNVRVLDTNRLLASYGARSNNASGGYLAEAGVFLSTNRGASWADLSHPGMKFYTHDVVVDPHDPSGNTWLTCVSLIPSTNSAGVYLTTNAGANWTRIFTNGSVVSATINPRATHSNKLYACTHYLGLWCSGDFRLGTPTFQQVTNFPFRFPQRVFFNPFQAREIWVNTEGNGTRVGTVTPLEDWRYVNFGANETNAAVAGDSADPDGDREPNLLEFFLGSDPNSGADATPPTAGMASLGGSNYLTLTFQLDTNHADATATVQVTADFTNWFLGSSYTASSSIPLTVVTTEISRSGGNPQTIVVRDNVPVEAVTRRAIKLRVSEP